MNKLLLVVSVMAGLLLLSVTSLKGEVSDDDFGRYAAIYHKTIFDAPYIAPASYAEYAKCEGVYCMFTEGAGYLHSSGYDAPVPVANFSFLANQIYKSERDTLWHKTKERLYMAAAGISYISDHQPGYSALFTSMRRFEMHGPMDNPRNFRIEQVESDNPEVVSFAFTQTRRIQRAPYSGVVHFDKESGLIIKAELEQTAFYSNHATEWIPAEATIEYMESDGYVFIKQAGLTADHRGLKHYIFLNSDTPIQRNMEVSSEEYMYLSGQSMNPFVRPLKLNNLFQSGFSSVPLADLRRDLEGAYPLEQQFHHNANQPFRFAIEEDKTLLYHRGKAVFEYAEEMLHRIKELHTQL